MKLRDTLDRSRTLSIAPSGTKTKGTVESIGGIKAFAFATAQDANESLANYAESVTMIYDAIALAPKVSGAINAGDLVYLDNQAVTKTSTGNVLIGVALESAQSTDTEILIHFNGLLGAL